MSWNKPDSDSPRTGPVQPIRPLASFYVRIEGEESGPYPTQALRKVPRFTLQTPLREIGSAEWKPAFLVIDLPTYFADSTPRDPAAVAAARAQIDEILSFYPRARRSTTRRGTGRIFFWALPCLGAFAFYFFSGRVSLWRDPVIRAAVRQSRYGHPLRHLLNLFPVKKIIAKKTFSRDRQSLPSADDLLGR